MEKSIVELLSYTSDDFTKVSTKLVELLSKLDRGNGKKASKL